MIFQEKISLTLTNIPTITEKSCKTIRCAGGFYCIKIFKPSEIVSFIEADNDCDREGTAICPYCGIDSVIGKSSGYPITEEFLAAMNEYWFK